LNYECECQDEYEEGVIEEVGKHVELSFLNLAAVNLVKYLHEDKRIKE